jgi:signal transduction histidine kinase
MPTGMLARTLRKTIQPARRPCLLAPERRQSPPRPAGLPRRGEDSRALLFGAMSDVRRDDLARALLFRAERALPELAFILTSFALGVFWFIALVILLTLGAGLAITLIGLPILAGTMALWVAGADLERWRARVLLKLSVARPYRPRLSPSLLGRAWERARDLAVWADLLYFALLFPLSIATFVAATVAVAFPIAGVTAPLAYALGAEATIGFRIDSGWKAALAALLGLALLPLAPYVVHALALVHGFMLEHLLGIRPAARLSLQVEELSRSRSEAVAAAVAERRRIERDLHDGGQQRLTALALDLGMARVKLESDPEAAHRLVAEAHEEAKLALADLRNLARGIHPAILTDRGLDAALSALAGRSPVPVDFDVDVPRRPSLTIESVAYFVVLEALANVAKHAGATSVAVRVQQDDGQLVVEVADDGRGGARLERDGGLEGLATRVASVDGSLTLSSPEGGPTIVRAVLPCES